MTLEPHLVFDGLCEEAFRFYQRHLGGEITTMLTWGNSPAAGQVAPEWHDKICHATLVAGAVTLAGADALPGQYARPQGFQLLLGIDDPAEAERIFEALAENGVVQMKLQQTFWAERFGVVTDRFGTPWEVNCGGRT